MAGEDAEPSSPAHEADPAEATSPDDAAETPTDAPAEEAAEARLTRSGSSRPLVAGGVAQWAALVERRMPTYRMLARATWDTSRRPADTIAIEIADWVRLGAPERKDAS